MAKTALDLSAEAWQTYHPARRRAPVGGGADAARVEPRRKRLEALSDAQLLETVRRPFRGDPLRVEPKTGKVFDGNARAYELLRRAQDAQSAIAPETRVPYQPYRPERSMFYDLTES